MTVQTFEKDENNRDKNKKTNLDSELRSLWQGWRDSNSRHLVLETSALAN